MKTPNEGWSIDSYVIYDSYYRYIDLVIRWSRKTQLLNGNLPGAVPGQSHDYLLSVSGDSRRWKV